MSPSRAHLAASAASFTVQYSFNSLSVAVLLLTSSRGNSGPPDFPEPTWAKQALLGVTFAFCAVGMVGLGVLGDLAGRRIGLLTSLWTVLAGALASSLVPASPSPYLGLALARALLGIGVGGLYPNAAALAHEDSSSSSREGGSGGAENTAWSFVWQTPGSVAPYLVALAPLYALRGTPSFSQYAWRVVLACGALPAAATIALVQGVKEEVAAEEAEAAQGTPWTPALSRALLGTAGCWFLYDVSAYGIGVYTPQILQAIFPAESVQAVLLQAVGSHVASLGGAVGAVFALRAYGSCWLQRWGFAGVAATALALGALFSASPNGLPWPKFVAFQALTFALSWGPNVSTYVLPAQLFPRAWRARAHGASASAGKLGAVVGTFCFAPVFIAGGTAAVMYLQLAVCAAGGGLSVWALPWEAGEGGVGGEGGSVGVAAKGGAGGGGGCTGLGLLQQRHRRGSEEDVDTDSLLGVGGVQ